jgi:hypothetical protein
MLHSLIARRLRLLPETSHPAQPGVVIRLNNDQNHTLFYRITALETAKPTLDDDHVFVGGGRRPPPFSG